MHYDNDQAMSDLTTKQCDVCGALKKEANHWWVLGHNSLEFRTYIVAPLELSKNISMSWIVDVCGEQCLTTAEERVRQGKDPRQPTSGAASSQQ